MSIFISPQDYLMLANECKQIKFEICGHVYKFWCKNDKFEEANYIFDKIKPIIEKNNKKNLELSFEKILLISLVEILSKDKDYKINEQQQTVQQVQNQQVNCNNAQEFVQNFEKEKQELFNSFIEVLKMILKEI